MKITKPPRAIWKFDIPVDGGAHPVTLPTPANVIHVATQEHGYVTLWAEVSPASQEATTRNMQVYGTGQSVEGSYVGTAHDRNFVWHLYIHDGPADV